MIARLREHQAFRRLARNGTRFRRSALWCTWCPEPNSTTTSVAFAIGRAYGPAVSRNRLRRRLRHLLRDADRETPLPPGLVLIGARPQAAELTFDQLRLQLLALIQQMRNDPRPVRSSDS